jgi:predicted transcriptional regulator
MAVIEKRKTVRRVMRSYRLREDLAEKIEKIASDIGESRTYVLESLVGYGLEAYEKERKKKSKD